MFLIKHNLFSKVLDGTRGRQRVVNNGFILGMDMSYRAYLISFSKGQVGGGGGVEERSHSSALQMKGP